MISYVRGELISIEEEKVIVEVNGVGFGIFMPKQSMSILPAIGEVVKLYTYMNVREDAMQLFGFLTADDLRIFKLLIGVSGIGPKGGLSILSHMTSDELCFAIMTHDVKSISGAPGIGKKTVEKLIIELKDKLNPEEVLGRNSEVKSETISNVGNHIQSEAVQALVALGYGNAEALKAVRQVSANEDATVEEVLKQALRLMF